MERGEAVKLELKYCERCGGLWIRASATNVYCPRCTARLQVMQRAAGGAA